MLENPIEQLVCDKAQREGWFVRKVKWISRRSAPDRLFAKDGRVLFIEFKSPGEKTEGGQSKEVQRMKEAGMEVHVCDGPFQAYRILGINSHA